MRKLSLLASLLVIIALPILALAGDTSVRGHWRDTDRDGIKDTYVEPFHRTSPNKTLKDNYEYPGNYNPYKGETAPGNPDTYERSHKQKNPYGW